MTVLASSQLENVRAIVTTRWNKSGYRPRVIRQIEGYYVDDALDNDADTWQVSIGDPNGDFVEALERDNEIRVQLFGVGAKNKTSVDYISTGMADDAVFGNDGILTLTGRDMSSLAADSMVPPGQFKHVRAWSLIERQAREIGFKQVNLAKKGIVRKVYHTDGSESYWEFWYRLYRREKMWLWTSANGILVANTLNYDSRPAYYFGAPKDSDATNIRRAHIPIERIEIKKSTQQRVGEVWVFGHKGDNGFLVIQKDPTLRGWVKKPRRILLDTESHTRKGAIKLAWEEIFEGKVGAVEVTITIADPGYQIRKNTICRLRVPEISYGGEFFIVGTRQQMTESGAIVEVRMREKQVAISRRVPKDPKVIDNSPRKESTLTTLGEELAMAANMPSQWGPYFVKAAKEFHGPWDFNLFLATLIAIADQETGGAFRNIRANGGPGGDGVEWYPPPGTVSPGVARAEGTSASADPNTGGGNYAQWQRLFANEPGPITGGKTFAVGPMQLYSLSYKHKADDFMRPGNRNEFTGGRWHPEHNIRAGAFALRDKLKSMVRDSGRDIDMWAGVSAYGHHYAGETAQTVPTRYAVSVKNKVFNDPAYLPSVQTAIAAAREAQSASQEGYTDGEQVDSVSSTLPSRSRVQAFFNNYNPNFVSALTRREAVVMAALWGHYNKESISYTMQGQRDDDFGPPPNVPASTDCSAFVIWCYKSAGAPDPAGFSYAQIGSTYSLDDHGQAISAAQLRPGDLVFYDNPAHVGIYVGDGKCISHGSDSGPNLVPIRYRPITQIRTYAV